MAYFDSTTKIDFTNTAQHEKQHQSHTNSSEYFWMDRTSDSAWQQLLNYVLLLLHTNLATAENVCLGQSSKNLLTLQDTQAKLQYGEILKILHFAYNYSLITEGAEWSFRFGNKLNAIASSVQIVKWTSQLMSWCQKDVSTTTVLPGKSYITKQFAALHWKYHVKTNIQLPKQP